jgi:hypothetical protein
LCQILPEDGIVCLDNGMYKIWFARNYRTRVANTLLLDNALATMAPGLPWAIMRASDWALGREFECPVRSDLASRHSPDR